MPVSYGIIAPDRCPEFVRNGFRQRWFFPHRLYYLPKCGPDGFKIASWMCGGIHPDQLWELVLFAEPSLVRQFPEELFFDDDIIWHQQQFGRPGQVASANLVVQGKDLYTMVHISDLVQRISRRRALKTRIENRFKGWNHLLLNAILHFASTLGLERILVANADWALQHTDPKRTVQPELFSRIYDRNVHELFMAEAFGPWWAIDVQRNRNRLVVPEWATEEITDEKTVCVCHDIERGIGHADSDPAFAREADAHAPAHLEQMLRVEREAGVTATYAVVGTMVPDVRGQIERDGHCLAFHSYDHRIALPNPAGVAVAPEDAEQLRRCREVDYRLKGYRVPQSRLTPELSDENLCFHNFEWLASSAHAFGFREPRLEHRLVKLPIQFDDYPLYRREMEYDAWEAEALNTIERSAYVAFGLHDCYGDFWLPRYAQFLDKVRRLLPPTGAFRTMTEVANAVFLRNAADLRIGGRHPVLVSRSG